MVAGGKLNKAGKAFGKVERKLFVEQFSRKELSTEYNDILLFTMENTIAWAKKGVSPKMLVTLADARGSLTSCPNGRQITGVSGGLCRHKVEYTGRNRES